MEPTYRRDRVFGILGVIATGALAITLAAATSDALAIDATSIADRMSVIGVISESVDGAAGQRAPSGSGIAVLKDRRAGRSFAVQVGESLPGEPNFTVRSVRRNAVIVSDGREAVTLTYSETASVAEVTQMQKGPSNSETDRGQRPEPVAGESQLMDKANAGRADVIIPREFRSETKTDSQEGFMVRFEDLSNMAEFNEDQTFEFENGVDNFNSDLEEARDESRYSIPPRRQTAPREDGTYGNGSAPVWDEVRDEPEASNGGEMGELTH